MKKILIISPVPTLPMTAGNRQRISQFVSTLQNLNHEVHFVYFINEDFSQDKMIEYFSDKVHFYNPIKKKSVSYNYIIAYFINKFVKIKELCIKIILSITSTEDEHNYNQTLDEIYDFGFIKFLKSLQKEYNFQIVLLNYVFLSFSLKAFNKKVFKILDTHDIFSDRYKLFIDNQMVPNWISLFSSEEKKGLDRANVIIGIQSNESEILRKRTKKNVVTIGHLLKPRWSEYIGNNNLLFIASNNIINIDALNKFIDQVFIKIKTTNNNIKLIIAGSICDSAYLISNNDSVLFYGRYKEMDELLYLADIVINPVFFGTGLKIKVIEALANSKVVITSKNGLDGLDCNSYQDFCIVTENLNEMYLKINQVLYSCDEILKTKKQALLFMSNYYEKNLININYITNNLHSRV